MSDPAWQYADASQLVVVRVNADGSIESQLVANPEIQAWLGAGNTPTPAPAAPVPVPSCALWQLQSVTTGAQWTAAQSAVDALGRPAVSAFWAHGTNIIPANSTTLLALGASIGLTADQVTALVLQASAVSIP